MTWVKLSDDFADEMANLGVSDAAFRTHVEGLLWTMKKVEGGCIRQPVLKRLAETDDPDLAVRELVDLGLWAQTTEGWQIIHHMEHQPEPEVIQKRKADTAARQRKHRMKKAGLVSGEAFEETTRDVTSHEPRYPGRAGTGRIGTGRDGNDFFFVPDQQLQMTEEEKDAAWDVGRRHPTKVSDVPLDSRKVAA